MFSLAYFVISAPPRLMLQRIGQLGQVLLACNKVRRIFLVQIVHRIPVRNELLRDDEIIVFRVEIASHFQRFGSRLTKGGVFKGVSDLISVGRNAHTIRCSISR